MTIALMKGKNLFINRNANTKKKWIHIARHARRNANSINFPHRDKQRGIC